MTFFFCLQRYQLLALVLLVSDHLLLAQLRRVHFVSTEYHQYKCLYEYRKMQVCHTVCLFLLPPRECSKAVCKVTYHHCKDKELRDSTATSFLLYLSMSTSPIIGLVIGHTKINPINSIIIALGTIWALILIFSRVYRKYFYRDDDD